MLLINTELHVKVHYVAGWENGQGVSLDASVTGVSIHIYGSAAHGTQTRQAYTGVVADGMRKWSTEDCASIRCAPPRSALKTCAENKPLLSFLLTNGAHVRVRTGEPLCFSNITDTGERCESAKRM